MKKIQQILNRSDLIPHIKMPFKFVLIAIGFLLYIVIKTFLSPANGIASKYSKNEKKKENKSEEAKVEPNKKKAE